MIATAVATPRVHVRAATEGDLPGIAASWRRSWRLSSANRRQNARAYNRDFDEVIVGGILRDPHTAALVTESGRDMCSWLCFTPGVPTIHYAYVRKDYRRHGLLWIMLAAAGVRDAFAYTCRPQEHRHRFSNERLGVEDAILDSAMRRGIVARYVRPEEFLG